MKKVTFILFVLIALAIKTNAQIPNNGFENWSSYGNGMNPDGWWCTNDSVSSSGTYFPITRSTDHYPSSVGSYSIKIQNDTSLSGFASMGLLWAGGWNGNNYPAFPVIGNPTSLCGYYKFFPQNKDTMRICIHLYYNGIGVAVAKMLDTATISAWTSFSIPFPTYTNADSASLMMSSFYSDGDEVVRGNSVLYIDNLSFNSLITSVPEHTSENFAFRLYPNPASDIVTLNVDNASNADMTLNIYNVIGTLVKSEMLNQNQRQINIGDLSNGVYIVAIKSKDFTENQRLIIQR